MTIFWAVVAVSTYVAEQFFACLFFIWVTVGAVIALAASISCRPAALQWAAFFVASGAGIVVYLGVLYKGKRKAIMEACLIALVFAGLLFINSHT